MLTKIKLNALLLLIALLTFATLEGQRTLDLEGCVREAVSKSILVTRGELNVENSHINLEQATKARYPNLNGNTSVAWNFGRTVDPTSNAFITETFFSNNYGINSGVVLFDGFRIKNNIKKGEIDLQAAEADNQQTIQDIALQTALAYLNVLFTQENITIAEQQLQVSRNQLSQVNKSIKAGAIPAAEALNVEAQIAQSESAVILSQNNYDIALFQLKQLMRISPSEEVIIEIPDNITIDTDPFLLEFEDIADQAIKNRHDLKAAQLRAESSNLDIDIAKAGYYPSLRLGANIGTNFSNQAREITGFSEQLVEQEFIINDIPVNVGQNIEVPIIENSSFGTQLDNFLSYGFGISLNVPIYNNGINKANVQRAELGIKNQELTYRQLRENFEMTLQQSLADARAAKRKLEASEKSLEAQRKASENLAKRFEIGSANSFEWENQKSQLEQAEVTALIDKYDYIFKIKVIEFYLGKPLNL